MVPFDRFSRREALRSLAAGTIGAAASAGWVEALCAQAQVHAHTQAAATTVAQDWTPRVLSAQQNNTVVVLTELVIPETNTPGAKAALVNRFIDGVLNGSGADSRERFLRGLMWIDERSRKMFGTDFATATTAQQTELLTQLADERNTAETDRTGVEFFRAVKSMTITGYYSTEIGLRRELGDDGRLAMLEFEGCSHPEHQP